MKEYIIASKEDDRCVRDCERVADALSDLLADYSEHLSTRGRGILSEDELTQLGEAVDILYDAAQILGSYQFKD